MSAGWCAPHGRTRGAAAHDAKLPAEDSRRRCAACGAHTDSSSAAASDSADRLPAPKRARRVTSRRIMKCGDPRIQQRRKARAPAHDAGRRHAQGFGLVRTSNRGWALAAPRRRAARDGTCRRASRAPAPCRRARSARKRPHEGRQLGSSAVRPPEAPCALAPRLRAPRGEGALHRRAAARASAAGAPRARRGTPTTNAQRGRVGSSPHLQRADSDVARRGGELRKGWLVRVRTGGELPKSGRRRSA